MEENSLRGMWNASSGKGELGCFQILGIRAYKQVQEVYSDYSDDVLHSSCSLRSTEMSRVPV